jgi:hypothetical protein
MGAPTGNRNYMVQLNASQLEQFNADGFLIFARFLSAEAGEQRVRWRQS